MAIFGYSRVSTDGLTLDARVAVMRPTFRPIGHGCLGRSGQTFHRGECWIALGSEALDGPEAPLIGGSEHVAVTVPVHETRSGKRRRAKNEVLRIGGVRLVADVTKHAL